MHILLQPVPGLSATLERHRTTILVAAAKCANIDSDIPRQAPPAITGNKMTPRGMRKRRAPRNLDSRLPHASCGSTRRDRDEPDTGSAPIPARGVVASPSLRRSRAPSPRRDLQPAARDDPSRRSPSGAPSARRPLPDRLPRAVRSPDLSAARSLAGRARRPSRTRNGDRKAEWTRIQPSGPPRHCTQPKPCTGVGGTRRIPPTRSFAWTAECRASHAVDAHTPEGSQYGPDGVLLSR